ncbi:hypothetical protein J6590_009958 [Homalodisca vitripennis]|nr:hypothetical protein J6590_009958 [Homalodisca vitripennis]
MTKLYQSQSRRSYGNRSAASPCSAIQFQPRLWLTTHTHQLSHSSVTVQSQFSHSSVRNSSVNCPSVGFSQSSVTLYSDLTVKLILS